MSKLYMLEMKGNANLLKSVINQYKIVKRNIQILVNKSKKSHFWACLIVGDMIALLKWNRKDFQEFVQLRESKRNHWAAYGLELKLVQLYLRVK